MPEKPSNESLVKTDQQEKEPTYREPATPTLPSSHEVLKRSLPYFNERGSGMLELKKFLSPETMNEMVVLCIREYISQQTENALGNTHSSVGPSCYVTHTLRRSDQFRSISKKYNESVETFLADGLSHKVRVRLTAMIAVFIALYLPLWRNMPHDSLLPMLEDLLPVLIAASIGYALSPTQETSKRKLRNDYNNVPVSKASEEIYELSKFHSEAVCHFLNEGEDHDHDQQYHNVYLKRLRVITEMMCEIELEHKNKDAKIEEQMKNIQEDIKMFEGLKNARVETDSKKPNDDVVSAKQIIDDQSQAIDDEAFAEHEAQAEQEENKRKI